MLTKPSGSHEQGLGAIVVSFHSEQIPPKRSFPPYPWNELDHKVPREGGS